jgi:hypothetical protein
VPCREAPATSIHFWVEREIRERDPSVGFDCRHPTRPQAADLMEQRIFIYDKGFEIPIPKRSRNASVA